MKLYNVSFNLDNIDNVIEPRIPESAAEDENKTFARVCLTDSVEHCMQAIASDNRDIRVGVQIIVRSVDTKDLCKKTLVKPETLFRHRLVPDALENNEYWYLGSIKFETALYTIMDFEAEYELAWSLIDINYCREVVHRYLPNIQVNRYKIPKHLYDVAMEECNRTKNWDAEDKIWDALAEVKCAQKIGIYNVKLKKEKTL